MTSNRLNRISYEESCRLLQRLGYPDVGRDGQIPQLPKARPQIEDEELGVTFFRTFVGKDVEVDESIGLRELEKLTLPRTFFCRSYIQRASFKNTDLSESSLCWNDFTVVNFTDADLSMCDLRASAFTEVDFIRTNLQDSDFRRSDFEMCDFTEANMLGVKLTYEQADEMELSDQQKELIDWQDDDGEEPGGG